MPRQRAHERRLRSGGVGVATASSAKATLARSFDTLAATSGLRFGLDRGPDLADYGCARLRVNRESWRRKFSLHTTTLTARNARAVGAGLSTSAGQGVADALICKQGVAGSSPVISTAILPPPFARDVGSSQRCGYDPASSGNAVGSHWPVPFIIRRSWERIHPRMVEIDARVDRRMLEQEATTSRLRHLAWPLGVLGLLIPAASATLVFLDRSAIHTESAADLTGVILPVGFVIIGALLVSRRPRNTMGWIFLGIAIFGGVNGIAREYVFRSSHFHHLPFVAWMAWLQSWVI